MRVDDPDRADPEVDGTGAVGRRRFWISVFTLGLVSASVMLIAPAFASGRTGDDTSVGSASRERIVACDSGVIEQGDVKTSSAVVIRVPEGTNVDPPEGCRDR